MSRKGREERRERKRSVRIGIVPDSFTHSRVGVLISRGTPDSGGRPLERPGTRHKSAIKSPRPPSWRRPGGEQTSSILSSALCEPDSNKTPPADQEELPMALLTLV